MLNRICIPNTPIVDIRLMGRKALSKVDVHEKYEAYETFEKDERMLQMMHEIFNDIDPGLLSLAGICGVVWLRKNGKKLELVSGYLTYCAVRKRSDREIKERTALCIIIKGVGEDVIDKMVEMDLDYSIIIKKIQGEMTYEILDGENGKTLKLQRVCCLLLRAFAGKDKRIYNLMSESLIPSKRRLARMLTVSEATARRWLDSLGWGKSYQMSSITMQPLQENITLFNDRVKSIDAE